MSLYESDIISKFKIALLLFDKIVVPASLFFERSDIRSIVKELGDNVVFATHFVDKEFSDHIRIESDGTILCYGSVYNQTQLIETTEDTIRSSGLASDAVISEKNIEKIINEIKKIKDTTLQKIIWLIIVALFVTTTAGVLTEEIKSIRSESKNEKVLEQQIEKRVAILVPIKRPWRTIDMLLHIL